jgi:hypothetical protein
MVNLVCLPWGPNRLKFVALLLHVPKEVAVSALGFAAAVTLVTVVETVLLFLGLVWACPFWALVALMAFNSLALDSEVSLLMVATTTALVGLLSSWMTSSRPGFIDGSKAGIYNGFSSAL